MSRRATPAEVRAAAQRWSQAFLDCRAYGHAWQPRDARHVARLRYYAVTMVCGRCGTIRHQELTETGDPTAQWYTHPDGYLTDGIGRITGAARGALRIAALTGVREVTGRATDEDLPRTRRLRAV